MGFDHDFGINLGKTSYISKNKTNQKNNKLVISRTRQIPKMCFHIVHYFLTSLSNLLLAQKID
jgi:hypothetical protein